MWPRTNPRACVARRSFTRTSIARGTSTMATTTRTTWGIRPPTQVPHGQVQNHDHGKQQRGRGPGIACAFTDSHDEEQEEGSSGRMRTVRVERYRIEVRSTDTKAVRLADLEAFVEKCYSRYMAFKNKQLLGRRMFFSYNGHTKSGRQKWKEMPWKTTKRYSNLVLQDKEAVLSKIRMHARGMDKLNARIGRPNQFHLLLWGESYGCGKTSLCKAICEEEYPDRHVVCLDLRKFKSRDHLESVFMRVQLARAVLRRPVRVPHRRARQRPPGRGTRQQMFKPGTTVDPADIEQSFETAAPPIDQASCFRSWTARSRRARHPVHRQRLQTAASGDRAQRPRGSVVRAGAFGSF